MLTTDKEFNILTQQKIFYKGVIEDNNDPLKIGRVKVRVLGVHDSNTVEVPTASLPWSNVIKSLDFGGFQSGVGISSVPTKGTWVWCFLENNDINSFIVFGAISGISKVKQAGHGFTDPSGVYPKNDYLGYSDYNKAQTPSYLNNNVIQTPGGHLVELNDGGHIKITHINGNYIQLLANGELNIFSSGNININTNATTNINCSSSTVITCPTTTINSDVSINGNLNVSGTAMAGGSINLNTHIHPGDSNGFTGAPIQ